MFKGKKGIIFGIANSKSIAYGIAKLLKENGAEIGYTYAGAAMKKRVQPLVEELDGKFCIECDVTKNYDIKRVFEEARKEFGKIDFIVHSIAFAPKEELRGKFYEVTRRGFLTAMDISVYSLASITKHAEPILNDGASIIALSYYGAEKVVENYNVMGVAKAALEASVRYIASDLGERQIRVNAVSAGPIKTLSASGIGGFRTILKHVEKKSPLRRNVTLEDISKSAIFLLSDLSTGVTGEVMHVDSGFSIMGV